MVKIFRLIKITENTSLIFVNIKVLQVYKLKSLRR